MNIDILLNFQNSNLINAASGNNLTYNLEYAGLFTDFVLFFLVSYILYLVIIKRKKYETLYNCYKNLNRIDKYNLDVHFTKISKLAPFNHEYDHFYKKNIVHWKNNILPRHDEIKNNLETILKNINVEINKHDFLITLNELNKKIIFLRKQYSDLMNGCKKILKFYNYSRAMVVNLQDQFQQLRLALQESNFKILKPVETQINEYITKTQDLFVRYETEETRLNYAKIEQITNNIKQRILFLKFCSSRLPDQLDTLNNKFKTKVSVFKKTYSTLIEAKFNLNYLNFDQKLDKIRSLILDAHQSLKMLAIDDIDIIIKNISLIMEKIEFQINFEINSLKILKKFSIITKEKYQSILNLNHILKNELEKINAKFILSHSNKMLIAEWEKHIQQNKFKISDFDTIVKLEKNDVQLPLTHEYSFYVKKIVYISEYMRKNVDLVYHVWKLILKKYAYPILINHELNDFYNRYNLLVANFNKLNETILIIYKNEFQFLNTSFKDIGLLLRNSPLDITKIQALFTRIKNKINRFEKLYTKLIEARNNFRKLLLKINLLPNKTPDEVEKLALAESSFKNKDYVKANEMIKSILEYRNIK